MKIVPVLMLAAIVAGQGAPASITVKPVLSESRGLKDWDLDGNGTWAVHGDVLTLEKAGVPGGPIRRPAAIAVLREPVVGKLDLTLDIRSTAPVDLPVRDVLLIFGYQSPTRFYYAHLSATVNAVHNGLFLVNDADRKRLDDLTSTPRLKDQAWHRARLTRDPATGAIEVFIDGERALSANDTTLPAGRVGVGSFDETGEFRNIVLEGTPAALPSR